MALLALFAPAPAASAHDSLESSVPAAGETVQAMETVTLTFSEPLLDLGGPENSFVIRVVGPDDRYYETGCLSLDHASASAPVALGPAGEYDVLWQVVSTDGHPISGEYPFSYDPLPGAVSAEGKGRPACGEAIEQSGGYVLTDDALLAGVAIGIVGLAAIGLLVAVLLGRRRRHPPTAEGSDSDGPDSDGSDSDVRDSDLNP